MIGFWFPRGGCFTWNINRGDIQEQECTRCNCIHMCEQLLFGDMVGMVIALGWWVGKCENNSSWVWDGF